MNKIRRSGRKPVPAEPAKGYRGILKVITANDNDNIPLPDIIELQDKKIMRLEGTRGD